MALLVPEYLQTQKYSAKRDRLTLAHGGPVQAGVWDANDFKVIQRALGANMTIDVNAGAALVAANDPGNAGLYHVVNDASLLGTTVAAAHATLPRIDSVYVQVLDTTDGGDPSDGIQLLAATGTATAGTTLDLRTGAPTVPTGALLLADILVPAASSSVVTANIRDRRPWARGIFAARQGDATTTLSTASTTPVVAHATMFSTRLECSGVPLQVLVDAEESGTAAGAGYIAVGLDGTIFLQNTVAFAGAGGAYPAPIGGIIVPAAGSHVLDLYIYSNGTAGTVTLINDSTRRPKITFEEKPRAHAPVGSLLAGTSNN